MNRERKSMWVLAAVLLLVVGAGAQEQKARPDLAKMFEKSEVMIAMRDGVKLHTEIYTPKDAK